MIIDKDVFENNDARVEVHHLQNGDIQFWIQSGINGLFLSPAEFADLYEIMDALVRETNEEG